VIFWTYSLYIGNRLPYRESAGSALNHGVLYYMLDRDFLAIFLFTLLITRPLFLINERIFLYLLFKLFISFIPSNSNSFF
jgi:hypothetical protein